MTLVKTKYRNLLQFLCITVFTMLAVVIFNVEDVKAYTYDGPMKENPQKFEENPDVRWYIENNTLYIKGSGRLVTEYHPASINGGTERKTPWYPYRNFIQNVNISTDVEIPNMSWWFAYCSQLKSCNIPDNVKYLDYTFHKCKSLITVSAIPSGVESLQYTFKDCTSLTGDIIVKCVYNEFRAHYGNVFDGTVKPIRIKYTGGCTEHIAVCIAETSYHNNVKVAQYCTAISAPSTIRVPVGSTRYNVRPTITGTDYESITVTSDNTGIATVSGAGNDFSITGRSRGGAIITVTATNYNGTSASTTFVIHVVQNCTAINQGNVSVIVGSSKSNIRPSITGADYEFITVKSNNTGIATVFGAGNNFTITGVKYGSTTVTITATNYDNTTVSKTFTVNVLNIAPAITTHPTDAVTSSGTSTSFRVTASGTNNVYQWYMSDNSTAAGTIVSGATSATYMIPASGVNEPIDGKYFYCVVSNTGNPSVTSNRAKLSVKTPPSLPTFSAGISSNSWANKSLRLELVDSKIAGSTDNVGYKYSIDSSEEWTTYDGPINWTTDTTSSTIRAKAYNMKYPDTESAVVNFIVKYDATAPVINDIIVEGRDVEFDATDATSGIAAYALSDSPRVLEEDWISEKQVKTPRYGVFYAAVRDNAGNVTMYADEIRVVRSPEAEAAAVEAEGVLDRIESEGYVEETYTEETWQRLQDVINAMNEMLLKENPTAQEIKDTQLLLEEAERGLRTPEQAAREAAAIESENLLADIASSGYVEEVYTVGTWKALQDAITALQNIVADETSLSSQVNDAIVLLEEARGKLKTREQEAKEIAIVNAENLLTRLESAGYVEETYTAESWKAYQDAIGFLQGVLAKEDTTSREINDAIRLLEEAEDGLQTPEEAAREAASIEAEGVLSDINSSGYAEGNYTADSWKALQDAIKALQDTVARETSTAQDIADAKLLVEQAREKLKTLEQAAKEKAVADAESLLSNIESSGYSESSYTEKSWKALQDAIAALQSLLSNENATSQEINNAIQQLEKARKRLRTHEEAAREAAALESAKNEANKVLNEFNSAGYVESNYKADTWKLLQDALAELQALLADENTTPEEIDAARNKLENAITGLKAEDARRESNNTLAEVEQTGYEKSEYTEESWTAMQEALSNLKEVLSKEDASAEEINAAKAQLDKAMEGLVKASDNNPQNGNTGDGDKINSFTDSMVDNSTAREKKVVLKVKVKKIKLGVREKYKLPVKVQGAKAKYKSYNKRIVTVNSKGKVTAKKTGKTKIRITAGKKKAYITVTVRKAPKKIALNKKKVTLKKGKKFQIKTKLPAKTASQQIKYKSSNKRVVTVNSKGKIVAKKKGKATITVTTFNKKKAVLKVTVR